MTQIKITGIIFAMGLGADSETAYINLETIENEGGNKRDVAISGLTQAEAKMLTGCFANDTPVTLILAPATSEVCDVSGL